MWIDRQDFLYAIRSARRAPLVSIIAVAALSVGIGLNAGVFTLLNSMFLSPPSQKDPSSFVQVYPQYEGWFTGADHSFSFTTDDFDAVRAHVTTLEDVAAWQTRSAILEQGRSGGSIPVLLVDCNS